MYNKKNVKKVEEKYGLKIIHLNFFSCDPSDFIFHPGHICVYPQFSPLSIILLLSIIF